MKRLVYTACLTLTLLAAGCDVVPKLDFGLNPNDDPRDTGGDQSRSDVVNIALLEPGEFWAGTDTPVFVRISWRIMSRDVTGGIARFSGPLSSDSTACISFISADTVRITANSGEAVLKARIHIAEWATEDNCLQQLYGCIADKTGYGSRLWCRGLSIAINPADD